MTSQPSLIFAFLAGVVTITTPCVLPILPPMLAGSVGHKLRPVFIVLGSAVSFTLMGGIFSAAGSAFAGYKEALRLFFIAVLAGFGAIMVDEDINELYLAYSSRAVGFFTNLFHIEKGVSSEGHPLLGAFLLGLSLGVLWVPCAGPILGIILAYAAIEGEIIFGTILLFTYSIGLGIPMLCIAYGGKYVSGNLEWTRQNSEKIKKVAGWVIILVALAILFGIDRYLQARLIPYFPDLESKLIG